MSNNSINNINRIIGITVVSLILIFSGLRASAQADTIKVSTLFTTHVIFASDITYADRSSDTALASKIVVQNKNMIAVKARVPFDKPCSISALESSGRMWTFIVVYDEHPSRLIVDTRTEQNNNSPEEPDSRSHVRGAVKDNGILANTWKSGGIPLLEDVLKQSRGLHHIVEREYDIELACENIFTNSDVTYLVFSVRNRSGISYETSHAVCMVESGIATTRTIPTHYERELRGTSGSLSTPPGEYSRMAVSMDKLTLLKGEVLRLYLYEDGGMRNLMLSIPADDVNKAKGLNIKRKSAKR